MPLNINTKITNNLSGYVADSKNIKGTYIVVDDYDDLANLPAAILTQGVMAYCKSQNTEGSQFWLYTGSAWHQMLIENDAIDISLNTSLSINSTYTFHFDLSTVMTMLEGIIVVPYINFHFSGDEIIVFATNSLLQALIGSITAAQLVIYGGEMYCGIIDINLALQQDNATLHFEKVYNLPLSTTMVFNEHSTSRSINFTNMSVRPYLTVQEGIMYKYAGYGGSSEQMFFDNKEFYDLVNNTNVSISLPVTVQGELVLPDTTTSIAETTTMKFDYCRTYENSNHDMVRQYFGHGVIQLGVSLFEVKVILDLVEDGQHFSWSDLDGYGTAIFNTSLMIEGTLIILD